MSFGQAFRGLASESLGLFGLADHGTELDKSQSDRLMMTNMGNTTSITQRAVAPTTMGTTLSEKFRSALDMPASKATIAEKGYVVALGDWTTSQNEGTELEVLKVPKVFMSSDYAIFGLLNYHEYVRCGLDITVQINPTEWQVGGLIVWIESCQDPDALRDTNYNNLLTYTSDILNCNVNNEVRLKQAFTFSRNYYELHQASNQPEDIFVVRMAVWSKLRVASGTSTKVSYKVTASLCDVELHGMRVKAQMMKGPSGYSPAGQMAIGPGIGAVNMSNMTEMNVNSHMTMGCEGFEMDSSFAGGVECKDFVKHLQTPCRFDTIVWSTTKNAGVRLAKWKVHPRQPANTYSTWSSPGSQSTNISLISTLFRYWRGDLIFTFQVFASKWHSGRLMLAFTPGIKEQLSDTSSLKVVSTCSAAQYDIHGPQSTFVYRVPYISATQYLDCDPAKQWTGWLYAYIYTQMAAPSTVSTDVEVICYISGADNFELFVPSYNAVQMGPDDPGKVQVKTEKKEAKDSKEVKSSGVHDVSAAAVVSHGQDSAKAQVFKESPMGAMEMPQYKPSKAGTFPELQDGKVLHKRKHTDLDVFMGRAHFWTSFQYSNSQNFIHDEALNWANVKGTLEAVSKCFTLFRGGLKLVVSIETLFQAEVYVCFRPKGVESLSSLEQMYKYGVVSFSTEQTHQVVLKLPWYQPIAANSMWSVYDGNFGYFTMAAQTGGSVKVHLALAFDVDSRFYTPRGCPTDSHFSQATKHSSFRLTRSLPDAIAEVPHDKYGAEGPRPQLRSAPDEFDRDFLRSSVARKGEYVDTTQSTPQTRGPQVRSTFEKAAMRLVGHVPQMKVGSGPILARRPSSRYPVDHYFIVLPDGRQYGFESQSGELFGPGFVVQEFYSDFEFVMPAQDLACVVQYMVGRYYRDYNFLTFNCEHWARSYAGDGERSTQTNKLVAFMGMSALPVAAAIGAVKPQMITEITDEEEAEILAAQVEAEQNKILADVKKRLVASVLESYNSCVGAGLKTNMTASEAVDLAGEIMDAVIADPTRMDEIIKQGLRDFNDQLLGSVVPLPPPPTQVMGVETKSDEPKTDKTTKKPGMFSKFSGKLAGAFTKHVDVKIEEVTEKTKKDMESWFRQTIMPTLESKGAKIAKKILNVLIDVAQAACLLHVAINYPVPGVVGPLAAAASMGALRGATRLLMRLSNSNNNKQKTQMGEDEDFEVTTELGEVLYDIIMKHVPTDMEPEAAKEGFIEKIKGFNIMASGVRNLVTLSKWIADSVKACVEYIIPGSKSRHLKALTKMGVEINMLQLIYVKSKDDMTSLTDSNLLELKRLALKILGHAIGARNMLKERDLVTRLTRCYTDFSSEVHRRQLQGDGLPRVEPVVIWFHGEKGCGKSLSSVAAASMICRKLGLDPRKEIYTKPVSAKYYDGYKQQKVMIMDDVGQNTSVTGTDFDDFCQLVSTAPLRLNMAHLDDKGVQFKTPIIIASSNIPDPEPAGISDTSAIRRRICDHRYLVTCKDYYCRTVAGSATSSGNTVLNAEKAKNDGVLKAMSCCEYHPGIAPVKDSRKVTLQDVVNRALENLDKKTQTHKSLVDMWFEEVEPQMAKGLDQSGNHDRMLLREICKGMGIEEAVTEEKVVPLWTKVLLGIGVVASMIAAMAGIGCAIWGISGAAKKKKPQGAYNATPANRPVYKVPVVTPTIEQAVGDVVQLVRGNIVQIGMRDGERLVYKVQGLFVRDLQLLIPRHFMTLKGTKPLLVNSRGSEFEYEHGSLVVTEMSYDGKQTDACLVTLPKHGVTPYKDIARHFITADQIKSLDGSTGVLVTNGTYGPTFVPESDLEFFADTQYGVAIRYNPAGVVIGKAATMDGMCGGGLVSAINKLQNPIIGIHVAGNGYQATTQVITREMLDQHAQSARIITVRECKNVGMSTKTQFTLSPLAKFFDSGKIPAVLGPSLEAEQDVFAMAIAKYNVPLLERPNDWGEFEGAFTQFFIDKYGMCKGSLSIEQAINGVDGLDGINMQTSPGYPWVLLGMRKRDLLKWKDDKWVPTQMLQEAVEYHKAEVMEAVEGFDDLSGGWENFDRQKCWEPPIKYITYYKDELRPIAKVHAGKTRVIEAAPIHHVIAFRQVFGNAMALLHKTSLWNGFAPGCDIEAEAKYLYYRSQKFPWIFDADYAGFDGSLQPFVMMSAMRVLGAVGCVDPITSCRWARLLVRSDHMFGSTELAVFGSMPSGSPATTIVNTISNMMMSYYATMKVTQMSMPLLFQHNLVVAYGDDLLVFSRDPEMESGMAKWADVQQRVFAATATSPSKDGPPRATPWDQVVFLRRTFVMRNNDIFACLDKKSIFAMFEWQRETEHHKQRVLSALAFAAAWGREFYDEVSSRLAFARVVDGYSVGPVMPFEIMERATLWKRTGT